MKRPFVPLILSLIALVILSACALSSNVNSYQVQGERVTIEPQPQESSDGIRDGGIMPLAALASLAPKLVSFTTSKIKAFYTRESEKYVASYGSTYVGEDFYREDGTMEYSYSGFTLKRAVRSGGQEVPASLITLGLATNEEKTLIQFLPTEIQLHKAKAKLRSGDTTVDLTINLVLNAWWQIKNGEIKSRELGDVILVLTGLELGETYRLEGEPNNRYLVNSRGEKSNYNTQSAWLAPVPISVSEQGNHLEHARGNYSLHISVMEIDDYGERLARFGKDVHEARGIFTELIDTVVDE